VHAAHGLLTKLSTGDDDGDGGNGNGDNCWLVQSAWPGSHAPLPIRDPCACLRLPAPSFLTMPLVAVPRKLAPPPLLHQAFIHSFTHSFHHRANTAPSALSFLLF
jgi:hypothetical protein